MKNGLHGLINRLDIAEERISELEDISVESSVTKKQGKQKLEIIEYPKTIKDVKWVYNIPLSLSSTGIPIVISVQPSRKNYKASQKIPIVIGIPVEERDKVTEEIFEIMTENLTKLNSM